MAKFYGSVGYAEMVEVRPGVWAEQIVTRSYSGDLLSNNRSLQNSGNVNDNVNVNNQISIIADPYATHNYHTMRYVEFMGAKWKVTNVNVQYPRLVLTLGGIYNGECRTTTE